MEETELISGYVMILNHSRIPNGYYIYYKNSHDNYCVTISYQDRHPVYQISETTLEYYLNKL
jgi:hypothetical protein